LRHLLGVSKKVNLEREKKRAPVYLFTLPGRTETCLSTLLTGSGETGGPLPEKGLLPTTRPLPRKDLSRHILLRYWEGKWNGGRPSTSSSKAGTGRRPFASKKDGENRGGRLLFLKIGITWRIPAARKRRDANSFCPVSGKRCRWFDYCAY